MEQEKHKTLDRGGPGKDQVKSVGRRSEDSVWFDQPYGVQRLFSRYVTSQPGPGPPRPRNGNGRLAWAFGERQCGRGHPSGCHEVIGGRGSGVERGEAARSFVANCARPGCAPPRSFS